MGYKKLDSMLNLVNMGLNVHKFVATKEPAEIIRAVHDFDSVCTIRTDGGNSEYKLPFYIINGRTDELESICNQIKEKDLIAIVANGLQYDKHLLYNVVFTLRENGDFWVEYCMENVPLRVMDKFPMNCYVGNIDDKIKDWFIARESDKRVDRREIRQFLIDMWNKGIYEKYLEASVYTEKCGMKDEYVAFWQVLSNKSSRENHLHRKY